MRVRISTSILLLLTICFIADAQSSFEIIALDGQTKAQRSQKRSWEKMTIGAKLSDNDMIETFFQTRTILKFSDSNILILGSNTKALLNIVKNESNGKTIDDVSLTLFGGGMFVKVSKNCHISIYTANAVGEMDSGSLSIVADAKSGETGVQVLGGKVMVRNIAQQKSKELPSGLTTIILTGKEPTAPHYITYRHVTVLKYFFGEDYIKNELEAAGIKPTDDRGSNNRLLLSQNMGGENNTNDGGKYKSIFSISKIYGTILADQEQRLAGYFPITKPEWLFDENNGSIGIESDFYLTKKNVLPSYSLTPTLRFIGLDAALRLSAYQTNRNEFLISFDSKDAVLDKIDHLTIGYIPDSVYVYAGRLDAITMGYGLVVNNYSNFDPYRIYQRFGAIGQFYKPGVFGAKVFVSDVTKLDIGGVYLSTEPGIYTIGSGFYFDRNKYPTSLSKNLARFEPISTVNPVTPDTNNYLSNAYVYEINFGADVVTSYEFNLKLSFEFAQKLTTYGNDGYIIRLPVFGVDWRKNHFGMGLCYESGRLISNMFDQLYLQNKIHLKSDRTSASIPIDTLLTQTSQLSPKRLTRGLSLTYKTNPFRGCALESDLIYNMYDKNSNLIVQNDSTGDSATSYKRDVSYNLSFSVNEDLFPFIAYANIYVRQNHMSLYPTTGGPVHSWGFEAGYTVQTKPILYNIAIETGGHFYYLDFVKPYTNTVTSSNNVFQIYAGLQWGFL